MRKEVVWIAPLLGLMTHVLPGCGNAPINYTAAKTVYGESPAVATATTSSDALSDVKINSKPTGEIIVRNGLETFTVNAPPPPPSDFVFVVDSSGSMEPVIESFVKGFESVLPSAYPPNSRMAVMNMIAHELGNPAVPLAAKSHIPLFKSYVPYLTSTNIENFMNAEPGYLKLLNAASVANFKSVANTNLMSGFVTKSFISHTLCESEWFSPGEKNSDETACLRAAMQISGMIGVESGLMSVLQILKKNSKPLFRQNAGVHFVFISDTHDPGNSNFAQFEEYLTKIPDFSAIDKAVRENSKQVSVVKLHGVVPFTKCAKSEWQMQKNTTGMDDPHGIYGGSYLAPIKASGGVAVDMCKNDVNYQSVVQQLLDEARKIPPFKLAAESVSNVSVKVNGEVHSNFKLIDNRFVEINGLITSKDYEIQVSYSY
jgi:hypothetical protein